MNYSLNEISKLVKGKSLEDVNENILNYLENSDKIGAKKILNYLEKQSEKNIKEKERYKNLTEIENKLYEEGITKIAGIDEAGRGPLAGPVIAACVILKPGSYYKDLKDSKKLSEAKRELLYDEIINTCIAYGVGRVSNIEIDQLNILNASKLAMIRAYENMISEYSDCLPQVLIIDSIKLDKIKLSQFVFNKAEDRASCVAAASIVAKVTRDHIMYDYDKIYTEYGFAKHKGYGTSEHIDMLKYYGPSKIHRLTFKKVLTVFSDTLNLNKFSEISKKFINLILSAHSTKKLSLVANEIRIQKDYISSNELSYIRKLYSKVKKLCENENR